MEVSKDLNSPVSLAAQSLSAGLRKRYGADPAKSKAREFILEKVKEWLCPYVSPKRMEVVTMLGPDATEIREIFDPLGIDRGRITSVERDQKVVAIQRVQNLGVKIQEGTVEDFLKSQKVLTQHLYILDYMNPIRAQSKTALKQIGIKAASDKIVVVQLNSASRDNRSLITYLNTGRISDPNNSSHLACWHDSVVEMKKRRDAGDSIKDFKVDAHKTTIIEGVGEADFPVEKFFREVAVGMLAEAVEQLCRNASSVCRKTFSPDNFWSRTFKEIPPIVVTDFCEDLLKRRLKRILPNIQYDIGGVFYDRDEVVRFCCVSLLHAVSGNCFHATKVATFAYYSVSGTPMLGTIVLFRKSYSLLKKATLVASMLRNCLKSGKLQVDQKSFSDALADMTEGHLAISRNEFPHKDLGGVAKPLLPDGFEMMRLLSGGESIESLLGSYRCSLAKLLVIQHLLNDQSSGFVPKGGIPIEVRNQVVCAIISREDDAKINARFPNITKMQLAGIKAFYARILKKYKRVKPDDLKE